MLFLSCKANSRVKLAKTGHGPHSSKFVVICVVLLFVFSYVLFVCKCVLYYCHRVTTQLQLTNISYLDFRGSVHLSTVHTEKSNKMQQRIKIYYSIFIWSSTWLCLTVSSNHTSDNLPRMQNQRLLVQF